jgi:hypothetical protein
VPAGTSTPVWRADDERTGDAAARAYIAGLESPRREQLLTLHETIRAAAPQLDVRLWDYQGTLIGYGTYPYSSSSGRSGEWFTVGLANRKAYVSVYSTATAGDRSLVEELHARLPGTKVGRSCLNLPRPEAVDLAVVTELVERSLDFHREHTAGA